MTKSMTLPPDREVAGVIERVIADVPAARSHPVAHPDDTAMEFARKAAHRAAIDAINGATVPLGVSYRLGGTGDLSLPTKVDRSAGSCLEGTTRAFTSLWLSGTNEITRAEMDWYSGTGEPADKAGGYAVQGRAAIFIRHIAGSYSGVVGLPLCETWELLREVPGLLAEGLAA